MKRILFPAWLLVSLSELHALPEVDKSRVNAERQAARYVAEAPLPKGWPKPGPYYVVSEKKFPAYRAAYTKGSWQNFAFMRLFKHIKRNKIPMTSPVEMKMEQKGDDLDMEAMGFLYQDAGVGKLGRDGKSIEVRDVAAVRALSYTWQGSNHSKNLDIARSALEVELQKRGEKMNGFRVLGYNGPGVSKDKKTWEMLAVFAAKK